VIADWRYKHLRDCGFYQTSSAKPSPQHFLQMNPVAHIANFPSFYAFNWNMGLSVSDILANLPPCSFCPHACYVATWHCWYLIVWWFFFCHRLKWFWNDWKKLSHFSQNVWKCRLVNTVMMSFNTTLRQMSQQKITKMSH